MKLHLLGASGSGVTTLGLSLAAELGVTYFDSDDYFWLDTVTPFTQRRDPVERNRRIRTDLDKAGSWILGGSVIHWGEGLFPVFDLVVFLYIPAELRIARLKERELDRYGEVIYTDPVRREQLDRFLAWAADYDRHEGIANRTLQVHLDWMASTRSPVLEIRGDRSNESRMAMVLDRLKTDCLL